MPILVDNDKKVEAAPIYSDKESAHIRNIMTRMLRAKTERDKAHPEFGNQTFREYYENNERLANTFIERKKGDNDIVISSGTVEQKLYAVVAEVNRLNLTAEVRAFDEKDNELQELGTALTDICLRTEEIDDDGEKKLIRQVELMKQGTVFVQENWSKEYKTEKDIIKDFDGKISSASWEDKIYKCFDGPRRSILYTPGVYLGNIREFDMKKQPFIFTFKLISYADATSKYGAKHKDGKFVWERFGSVPKERVTMLTQDNITSVKVNDGFALTDLQNEMVEEVHYQDKFNNEYQIFLNGIAMLPAGFPLTRISPSGEYNVEKQVFQVINPFFAYGRSFVARTQNLSDLLDEMLRLLILKTRKSIHPPYANISGKVISAKALMPGRISMGIDPGALVKIGEEGQGVTAAEYQMLSRLQDNIDRVTVSPQFQGQQGKSGTTAYEANLLAQQAQKVLSLTIFAASLLEQKLGYLRLYNILGNYLDPIGQEVDEARGVLKNRYRTTSRKVDIPGRGRGIRQIIPMDGEMPDSDQVMEMEDYEDTPVPEVGRRRTREEIGLPPLQKIFIDRDAVKAIRMTFHVEVEAKEKDTSLNAKAAFRDQLRDIQALVALGSAPETKALEEDYARIWNKQKDRLFNESRGLPPVEGGQNGLNKEGLDLTQNNVEDMSSLAPLDVTTT